ncbi:hypothetical protein LNQ03_03385 [Klebsiella pneumoniae subsp. pneumoniae]|nr:hypothetical protein [Klebsiella pneumoniae subsp. pneumoniae]
MLGKPDNGQTGFARCPDGQEMGCFIVRKTSPAAFIEGKTHQRYQTESRRPGNATLYAGIKRPGDEPSPVGGASRGPVQGKCWVP